MVEGGFVPYDFFSPFETDIFEFDTSDALKNFTAKHKVLFIGSFIIVKYLIDKILMMQPGNGFSSDVSDQSLENLRLLGALFLGIFSEVIFDMFKSELLEEGIYDGTDIGKRKIIEEYIYARYKVSKELPEMKKMNYAWATTDENDIWWKQKKD